MASGRNGLPGENAASRVGAGRGHVAARARSQLPSMAAKTARETARTARNAGWTHVVGTDELCNPTIEGLHGGHVGWQEQ